jgi:hypothetical protein
MNKTGGRHTAPAGALRAALQALAAVRRGQGKVHPLDGMLALAVCALRCGGRSLHASSQWGRECDAEIREALGLRAERGPRVATLHRTLRRRDHAAFEQVLGPWCAAHGRQPDEALAIEGTTLRGLHGDQLAGVQAVLAALRGRLLAGRVVTGEACLAQRAVCRQLVRTGGTPSSC